jgi:TolB-like protein/Flp pilus assembly protein TadD
MASKLAAFLAELKRRKVYHVAVAYTLVGVGVLGAAEVILDPLGLGRFRFYLVILVLLGFPIALVLAWVYEVRPEKPGEPNELEPENVVDPQAEVEAGSHDFGGRKSIVVLPFDNMSPDPGDVYFSDGLTEEIITNLSYLRSLRVISRASAMALKGTEKSVRAIGEELGVEYVLEGSVRKAGNDLLVTAQLIGADTDEHLWAEKYDGVLDDVFAIQEKLSQSIVDALGTVLEGDLPIGEPDTAAMPATHAGTENPAARTHTRNLPANRKAYDAYLKGKYALRQTTEEAWHEAIRWFERAIELDPGYAQAYVGKAEAETMPIMGWGVHIDPEELRSARSTIERAIELDPENPEAYIWRGLHAMHFDWDRGACNAAFSRALYLNPANPEVHTWHAWHLGWVEGDFQAALRAVEVAAASDPLNLFVTITRGYLYYAMADFERALEDFESVKTIEPTYAQAYYGTGDALAQMGRVEDAIREYEKCIELGGRSIHVISLLAYAHGLLGEEEKAREYIAELEDRSKSGFISSAALAWAHIGLGELETALDWLEKALEDREPPLVWMSFTHEVDPLRDHSRFKNIFRKMGLGHLVDREAN